MRLTTSHPRTDASCTGPASRCRHRQPARRRTPLPALLPARPPAPAPLLPSLRRRRVGRLLLAVTLTIAVVLVAAAPAGAVGPDQVVALADSVDEVLDNLRDWLMGILAALATLFLTVGGVRYVMAGGNPGEVEKAKSAVRSAGIGYALAALAPLVVEVLKNLVGA